MAARRAPIAVVAFVATMLTTITPAVAGPDHTPYIVGGDEAAPGDWPFVAYVTIDAPGGTYFCGGTLVDPSWVLTAAHCMWEDGVVDPGDVTVVLGEHDLTDPSEPVEVHAVTDVRVHPEYVHEDPFGSLVLRNDLALVELETPSSFSTASPGAPEGWWRWTAGTGATIVGWGRTVWDVSGGSDTLQQATVPVLSDAVTAAEWSATIFDPQIKLGAGGGSSDVCKGDSGGPLLVPDGADGWLVAGVVSGGVTECGSGVPSLFTRVSAFHAWISGTVDDGVTTLVDTDGAAGDRFGWSLDLDGSTLIVGSPEDDAPEDGSGPNSGSMSIWEDDGGWSAVGGLYCPTDLTSPDSEFNCGWSVAVDGATALFGAPFMEQWTGADWRTGEAFVVLEAAGVWAWSGGFLGADAGNDRFGWSVDVSGDRIVVGAPYTGYSGGSSPGAILVYDGPEDWDDPTQLLVSSYTDLQMGWSVAIDGDLLAAGARAKVYVYRHDGTDWSYVHSITRSGGELVDVALSGDRLVVGNTGVTYGEAVVYRWNGSSFVHEQTLTGPTHASGDTFGQAVAIHMDRLVVTDPSKDDAGFNSGLAYLYRRSGTTWSLERVLRSPDGEATDEFGTAAAISGPTVAVGAAFDDNANGAEAGSVYVFELDTVGPITSAVGGMPDPVMAGAPITISATIDDGDTGGSTIIGATVSVDGAGAGYMGATDGSWDATVETVELVLPGIVGAGDHEVCVTGYDVTGNAGDPRCTDVTVDAPPGDETAPVVSAVSVTPNPVVAGNGATLTATVDDRATGGSAIRRVIYSVTEHDTAEMVAVDGAIDGPYEMMRATMPAFHDTGYHAVCVLGSDVEWNSSDSVCIGFDVVADTEPEPEPLDPGLGGILGLADPATGLWHLPDHAGNLTSFFFGNPGDVPFMGDWDCDGVDTPGLFRQSDAYAYLRNSNTQGIADVRFFFGNPSDVPLAGDFDGDGCDSLSIYRPSQQRFYIMNQLGADEGGLGAAEYSFVFGNPGDKPVVGDWDGDGVDEIGLHRESSGFFYYRDTLTQGTATGQFFFGDPGDRFVAGDWGAVDGRDSPAVYRPGDTTAYFRHTLTPGNADSWHTWGESHWLPVAGDFGS